MIGRAVKGIWNWITKHGNLILLALIILECILSLYSSWSGLYVEREYKRQQVINQTRIEKAETDKTVALLEAQKEAEVYRIKAGIKADIR